MQVTMYVQITNWQGVRYRLNFLHNAIYFPVLDLKEKIIWYSSVLSNGFTKQPLCHLHTQQIFLFTSQQQLFFVASMLQEAPQDSQPVNSNFMPHALTHVHL